MNTEEIKKQAKEILDKFARALEGVKTEETKIVREKDRRIEGEDRNNIDRRIMFGNAPVVKGECIEAEKGSWV